MVNADAYVGGVDVGGLAFEEEEAEEEDGEED